MKRDKLKPAADPEFLRQKREASVRKHRKTILFNDKELEAIDIYCKKYKVKSKTKFCREAIISAILKQFDEDHPKLF
ncbi:MAG: hypothetical protein CVU10_01490 [Bacteroidetes bacterium HGW-Bacteroidetes-5]|nr:MAG: hypothetical protein CVU10_01490 [Bacteroidetes bacterium HGW-Bacteroidetes-5]